MGHHPISYNLTVYSESSSSALEFLCILLGCLHSVSDILHFFPLCHLETSPTIKDAISILMEKKQTNKKTNGVYFGDFLSSDLK